MTTASLMIQVSPRAGPPISGPSFRRPLIGEDRSRHMIYSIFFSSQCAARELPPHWPSTYTQQKYLPSTGARLMPFGNIGVGFHGCREFYEGRCAVSDIHYICFSILMLAGIGLRERQRRRRYPRKTENTTEQHIIFDFASINGASFKDAESFFFIFLLAYRRQDSHPSAAI